MLHTNSNLSKKSSFLPLTITDQIRGLPSFNRKFSSLWEEMSSLNIDNTIISHMDSWGEELAIDLHRLNENQIEELSGDLWLKWRDARETTENLRRGIRGNKKEITESLTEDDMADERYRQMMRQHGRPAKYKVGVEYSGGAYSNEELLSYFNDNKDALESISSEMSFEAFVDNFLVSLSSVPRVSRTHQGKKLGIAVPSILLEMVQDDIEFETYDLSESTFQSGLNSRQMKELQVKYDDAVDSALVSGEDSIKGDMRSFIEEFIQKKEKGTVYNKDGLVNRIELSSYRSSINFGMSDFDALYDNIGGVALLRDSIKSEFEGGGEGGDFDVKMVDEGKFKNGLRQIADALFTEVRNEKVSEARTQLKTQINAVNSAWKSNKKLSNLLDILKRNEATTNDVQDFVGRLNFGSGKQGMKSFYDEILDGVNVEKHFKTSIQTKRKISRKHPEKAKVVESYIFKRNGKDKLYKEVDGILEGHSAFSTVSSRAKAYAKLKIKQRFAEENNIEVDQIIG